MSDKRKIIAICATISVLLLIPLLLFFILGSGDKLGEKAELRNDVIDENTQHCNFSEFKSTTHLSISRIRNSIFKCAEMLLTSRPTNDDNIERLYYQSRFRDAFQKAHALQFYKKLEKKIYVHQQGAYSNYIIKHKEGVKEFGCVITNLTSEKENSSAIVFFDVPETNMTEWLTTRNKQTWIFNGNIVPNVTTTEMPVFNWTATTKLTSHIPSTDLIVKPENMWNVGDNFTNVTKPSVLAYGDLCKSLGNLTKDLKLTTIEVDEHCCNKDINCIFSMEKNNNSTYFVLHSASGSKNCPDHLDEVFLKIIWFKMVPVVIGKSDMYNTFVPSSLYIRLNEASETGGASEFAKQLRNWRYNNNARKYIVPSPFLQRVCVFLHAEPKITPVENIIDWSKNDCTQKL